LHDNIKASLESKYDPKEEAMRNIGGTVAKVMIPHTYLELHYFLVKNSQTAVTPRISNFITTNTGIIRKLI
jgi:hypothetical protein